MSSQNCFANASPSPNTLSASTTSTSTVRSRPRRLISFMDDEDDSNNVTNYTYQDDVQPVSLGVSTTLAPSEGGTTRSRGATPSPLSSRGASPLPLKHLSRATESMNSVTRSGSTSFFWNGSSKASSSGGAADFLDSSWSSLQSLASSVLGSDAGQVTANNVTKNTHTRRKPSRSDVFIKSGPRSTWGPSAPTASQIGTGTKEERQALVQAKKREALLLADSDLIVSRTLPHKRRDSGDVSYQAFEPEHDEDALAYIHKVQPTDTITGVTIKYGCQSAVFRKANGFWPNDNIQSRNTVLLPVDACSVKGRLVPTKPVDLLRNNDEDPSDSSIAPTAASTDLTDNASTEQDTPATTSGADGNHVWKHVSWVHMDGFPGPVQIGRVPRRALGFFPRTRRKSMSYSDTGPLDSYRETIIPPSPAGSSPPFSSFGILPRARPNGNQSQPKTAHHPRSQHRRQRSSIHLSATGVGTLDPTSTGPGPALDGFTRFFAQHMPNLAPAQLPDNSRSASFDSTPTVASHASTGLENIGGAFEGWVRKVATRAKAGINELQQGPPTQQGSSRGRSMWRMDDLIELDDGMVDGRNSPSPLKGPSRRSELQTTSSSSSSNRYNSPSVVAASRSRATEFGSGSGLSAYGERVKDD
ncbi:LysM domain protein [Penicillium digitatum]|nr:LysM domain protein [Penicillium digitatum]